MSRDEFDRFFKHQFAFVGGTLYTPELSQHYSALEFETVKDAERYRDWLTEETVVSDYTSLQIVEGTTGAE